MVENGIGCCGVQQQTINHRSDPKKHIIEGTFEIDHSPWLSLSCAARSLAIRIYSSQKQDPSTKKGLQSENADMMKGKVLDRKKPIMKGKRSLQPRSIIKFSFKFKVVPEFGPPGAFVIENKENQEFFLKSATLQYTLPAASNNQKFNFYCNSWVYPLEKTGVKRVFFVNELYLPEETPSGLVELRRKQLEKLREGSNDERKPWDRIYQYDKYNDLGDPDNGREYSRLVLGGSSEFPYPRRLRTGRPRCRHEPSSESRPASIFQTYVPPDERMSPEKQKELKKNFFDALVRFLSTKQNQPPGTFQELPDFIKKIAHFFVPSAAFSTEDFKFIMPIINFIRRKPKSSSHQEETCSFDSVEEMYGIFAEKEVKEMEDWVKEELQKFVPSEIFNEVVATAATQRNPVNSQLPSIIAETKDAWREDEEFGRQLLAGTNPVRIRCIKESSHLIEEFKDLMKETNWRWTSQEIRSLMKDEFWDGLMKEKISKELMEENFPEESIGEKITEEPTKEKIPEESMGEKILEENWEIIFVELIKEKIRKSMKEEIRKSMKEKLSKESMKENISAESKKEKCLEESMKDKFTEELLDKKISEEMIKEEEHFKSQFLHDLEEDIKMKRFFILDHHDYLWPDFLKMINGTGACAYATRTFLYAGWFGTIQPIAIELSLPNSESRKVVFPDDDFRWELAKMHVAANDAAYHQLVSHWLHTHAVIEPFIIATRRQLSVMHPIHRLLDPHFKDTLHINALARGMFLNAGGILERTLFTGEFSMRLSSELYKKWRFDEQALPADLKKRGMAEPKPETTTDKESVRRDVKAEQSPSDKDISPPELKPEDITDKKPVKKDENPFPAGVKLLLKDYPYARDGTEIWDAIEKWVREYCNIFYTPKYEDLIKKEERLKADEKVEEDDRLEADKRVREDTEIQRWWKEIRDVGHGDLKDQKEGWYDLNSLEDLIKALTTIIWITSGLHAAVNFGQYAYAGWPPNRPMLLRKFIPEPEKMEEAEANREKFMAEILPEKFEMEFVIAVMDLLSRHTSDEVYLGQNPTENMWGERETVNNRFKEFRERLGEIEINIKERNKNYNLMNRWGYAKIPYKLLYPDTKAKAPSKEKGKEEKMDITGRGIPNSISI